VVVLLIVPVRVRERYRNDGDARLLILLLLLVLIPGKEVAFERLKGSSDTVLCRQAGRVGGDAFATERSDGYTGQGQGRILFLKK
jgi:hypothetical protein